MPLKQFGGFTEKGSTMSATNLKHSRSLAISLLSSVALLTPLSAMAQEGDSAEAADPDRLGTVIVTAQKRAQSANDIGVAVTAFSGENVEEYGFQKPADIGAQTPGLVTVNPIPSGSPIFAIRGIGLDDFNANNTSGVAVYVDEVYAPSPTFLNGVIYDIERVEVLKGPQGTLYGRNSTGGAINFVNVRPSDETEGFLKAGYGNFNRYTLQGAVGGALSERVRARASVKYDGGDGWQDDIVTGREFGEIDRLGARLLVDADLTDNAELQLNFWASKDDGTAISQQVFSVFPDVLRGLAPGTVTVGSQIGEPDVANAGTNPLSIDEEGQGASAKLIVDFENVTFTSITAVGNYDRHTFDNSDGQALSAADITFIDESKYFSQEFRLASDESGRFSWIAGLTYADEEVEGAQQGSFGAGIDLLLDLNAPLTGPFRTGGNLVLEAPSVQETKSFGAYVHTETDITDSLNLTAGLRYSRDERDFRGDLVSVDGGIVILDSFGFVDSPGVPVPVIADFDESEEDDNVSGKIGLDYDVNDNVLIYGSVATSYKSGVFLSSPLLSPLSWGYAEPEEIVSYEIGSKLTLWDNRMQVNAAVFKYDYEDRQALVTAVDPATMTLFASLANVPEAEAQGAELEIQLVPTSGLELRAGVAYLDTEITEVPTSLRGSPLILAAPINVGDDLTMAPEWSFNFSGRYEWDLGQMPASILLTYSNIDEQLSVLADPGAQFGKIEDLGLRFSVSDPTETWTASIWGKNLQDNDNTTYSFTNLEEVPVGVIQEPTTYGIEISRRF